jgi:hypothetical protein
MSEFFHNPNTKSDRVRPIAPLGAKHAVYGDQKVVIRRYAAHDARWGAQTFEPRGGLASGPTSHNGLGVVPRAFVK